MKSTATLALVLTAAPLAVAQTASGPQPTTNDLEFPNQLNFAISLVIWFVSFIILLSPKKPAVLKQSPVLVNILWYWFAQWLCFTLVWLLVVLGRDNETSTLLFSDLQSMLTIGFSIGFLMGRDYLTKKGQVIGSLVLVFTAFLIFDVGTSLPHTQSAGAAISTLQSWRLAPSQVLSVVADAFLAVAFLFRYGAAAVPIILACIAYASLQHPAYQALVSPTGTVNVRLALVAGKAFLGSAFYATFFQPPANYDPIILPIPASTKVGPILRGGFAYLFGLALVFVGLSFFNGARWLPDIRTTGLWLLGLLGSAGVGEVLKLPIAKLLDRLSGNGGGGIGSGNQHE